MYLVHRCCNDEALDAVLGEDVVVAAAEGFFECGGQTLFGNGALIVFCGHARQRCLIGMNVQLFFPDKFGTDGVCRLLEGEFLDWRRVLPQNQPVKLAVNVAKMTDSIERVGLIISEKLKSPVRCKFGENTADFRSVSTIGEAHDVCQIAGDGQDMEIGFNCRYLLDALRAIPDAECSLELINGLSPIVMNPCDGSERYSYMVLPVRLKAGE